MAVELMKLRLDKYLADMGIGTRTEVKKAITKGQVRVNEETVKRPEIKIDTEKDHVFYQGQIPFNNVSSLCGIRNRACG